MKRTKFTDEQIVGILQEQEAGAKTADLCRKHGVSSATFYAWKAKFGGMEVSDAKRLKALEDENAVNRRAKLTPYRRPKLMWWTTPAPTVARAAAGVGSRLQYRRNHHGECRDGRPRPRQERLPGSRRGCRRIGSGPPEAASDRCPAVLRVARTLPGRHGGRASSHHWAREIGELGHEVRLMPPAYVKPYVKRGKTDASDAEAICEAVTRPTMRFVAVKSVDQQAVRVAQGSGAAGPAEDHADECPARPSRRTRYRRGARSGRPRLAEDPFPRARTELPEHAVVAIGAMIGQRVDQAPADHDVARGDFLKPGDHAQQRRFSAARRADQDHEFPIGDVDGDAVQHLQTAVALAHVVDGDRTHLNPLPVA